MVQYAVTDVKNSRSCERVAGRRKNREFHCHVSNATGLQMVSDREHVSGVGRNLWHEYAHSYSQRTKDMPEPKKKLKRRERKKYIKFRRKLGTKCWARRRENTRVFHYWIFKQKSHNRFSIFYQIESGRVDDEWASGKWTRIKNKSLMDNTTGTVQPCLLHPWKWEWRKSKKTGNWVRKEIDLVEWFSLGLILRWFCAQKSQIIK